MELNFNGSYSAIPARLKAALTDYVNDRCPMGDFLTACVRNDLTGAVCRADNESLAALKLIAHWLHNEAPMGCHGSREAVAAWLKGGSNV